MVSEFTMLAWLHGMSVSKCNFLDNVIKYYNDDPFTEFRRTIVANVNNFGDIIGMITRVACLRCNIVSLLAVYLISKSETLYKLDYPQASYSLLSTHELGYWYIYAIMTHETHYEHNSCSLAMQVVRRLCLHTIESWRSFCSISSCDCTGHLL